MKNKQMTPREAASLLEIANDVLELRGPGVEIQTDPIISKIAALMDRAGWWLGESTETGRLYCWPFPPDEHAAAAAQERLELNGAVGEGALPDGGEVSAEDAARECYPPSTNFPQKPVTREK